MRGPAPDDAGRTAVRSLAYLKQLTGNDFESDWLLQSHNPQHNNSSHLCAKLGRLAAAFQTEPTKTQKKKQSPQSVQGFFFVVCQVKPFCICPSQYFVHSGRNAQYCNFIKARALKGTVHVIFALLTDACLADQRVISSLNTSCKWGPQDLNGTQCSASTTDSTTVLRRN